MHTHHKASTQHAWPYNSEVLSSHKTHKLSFSLLILVTTVDWTTVKPLIKDTLKEEDKHPKKGQEKYRVNQRWGYSWWHNCLTFFHTLHKTTSERGQPLKCWVPSVSIIRRFHYMDQATQLAIKLQLKLKSPAGIRSTQSGLVAMYAHEYTLWVAL